MDIIISLKSEVLQSNFPDYKNEIIRKIDLIKTDLETDDDFAEAEQIVKDLSDARKAIAEAREKAINDTASIRSLFEEMVEIEDKLSSTEKTLRNQISTKKEQIKQDIINKAIDKLDGDIKDTPCIMSVRQAFVIDRGKIDGAAKRKRSVETMEKALTAAADAELDRFIEFASKAQANSDLLSKYDEHQSLFQDRKQLLLMEHDALENVIESRISAFNANREADELKRKEKENKLVEGGMLTGCSSYEPVRKIGESVGPLAGRAVGDNFMVVKKETGVTLKEESFLPGEKDNPFNDKSESYVITIIMRCSKEQAVSVARSVHEHVSDGGMAEFVESVNLKIKQ